MGIIHAHRHPYCATDSVDCPAHSRGISKEPAGWPLLAVPPPRLLSVLLSTLTPILPSPQTRPCQTTLMFCALRLLRRNDHPPNDGAPRRVLPLRSERLSSVPPRSCEVKSTRSTLVRSSPSQVCGCRRASQSWRSFSDRTISAKNVALRSWNLRTQRSASP